jgi:hypothetical protein
VRILIVGSSFRGYNNIFEKGFKEIGHYVEVFVAKGLNELKEETKKTKIGINELINNQSEDILLHYKKFNPDFVFVRLGNYISDESVVEMSKKSITTVYLGDSLIVYPEMKEKAIFYDIIFSYEQRDVDFFCSMGLKSYPLMGVFDEDQYFPVSIEKDIDISFIGAMYDERIMLLNKLSKDFHDKKLHFIGNYSKKKYLLNYIFIFTSKMKKSFFNHTVDYREANLIYNRSKICLNLNRKEANTGWNSRLCEILGTNSFQLTNFNETSFNEFENCLEMFKDYEELKDKIDYFLSNEDRIKIASKGYEKVKYHTNKVKLNELLMWVESFEDLMSKIHESIKK